MDWVDDFCHSLGTLPCISKTHIYRRTDFPGVPSFGEGERRWLLMYCGVHGLVPSLCSSGFTKTEESLEIVSTLCQAVHQLLFYTIIHHLPFLLKTFIFLWAQSGNNNWNLRSCHTVSFSGSSVHMGIFKEPLIVSNPKIFLWIFDFHPQQSTVSMNCSVGISLSKERSLPTFPNRWRNNWKSRLWGGLLSLLVSSKKKSYPAVSVRMTFCLFYVHSPQGGKSQQKTMAGCYLDSEVSTGWAGKRSWEGTGKQLGKREQDLGTWVYVKQENRLHRGKLLELQQEASRSIW